MIAVSVFLGFAAMESEVFKEFQRRIGVHSPWSVIDEVVVSDQNVLRPVKGYAFEIIFDEIVHTHLKCVIGPGPGGDSDIDRILVNNQGKQITMQLKTCATATVVHKHKFGVSLHKTHGEEARPRNLYPIIWPCPICPHSGEEFPDYLVILHPESGVLIVPKQEIPESNTYPGHYADPAIFEWDSEWLNRWDLLGFPTFQGRPLERRAVPMQDKFPRIAQSVHLTDWEIVQMWLQPENFRAFEMNLKGNLREPALAKWLKDSGVDSKVPNVTYPKYDRITDNGTRIQTKGLSKRPSNVTRNILGVEVMGSHRQGADRMYSDSDFDYLGIVIDPPYIPEGMRLDRSSYHYCLVPMAALPLHFRNKEWGTTNRIYPICKFVIACDGNDFFLKPSDNYRLPVTFRESGPWYIDKIPPGI